MYFFLPSSLLDSRHIQLDSESYQHLKSHRLSLGEEFWVTDMAGRVARCTLRSLDKKRNQADVEILEKKTKESDLRHVLVQAIPDKAYLDKLIEAATLAGFAKIVLYESSYSPKQNLNLARLQKISLQAGLLAEYAHLPELLISSAPVLLADLAEREVVDCLVLDQAGRLGKQIARGEANDDVNDDVLAEGEKYVWVGPEGGWSRLEKDTFEALGWVKVCLRTGVVYPAWLAGSAWRMRF